MDDPKLRVTLPPDPCPHALRFTPPPGTWDTHFHVFGPPHRFPYVEQRRYTPPAAPIEHFLMMAFEIGVERGVLVQPNVHGFENAVVLDAIERSDGRIRGMIRANPALDAGDLRALHAKGVRGVRFNFTEHLGSRLDVDLFREVTGRVSALGWPAALHIDAEQIEREPDMIRRSPVPVVIDHFGRVDATKGVGQPAFRVILDLLGEGNVWIKISGADRLVAMGASYADTVPFARALIERAPGRVIWGTDWPHSNIFKPGETPNDGDLMNLMLEFAPDEATRNRILAENPAKLFDFD